MASILIENSYPRTRIRHAFVRDDEASELIGKELYTLHTVAKETYGAWDIAKRMAQEGCLLKESAIVYVLHDFIEMVNQLAEEGCSVTLGKTVRIISTIQ